MTRRHMLSGLLTAALLAIAGTQLVIAADAVPAADTGTITGKVVDGSGAVVANADVMVLPPMGGKDKKHHKKAENGEHTKPEPIAKGTTDASGLFSLANVPAGKYTVAAMAKKTGHGHVGTVDAPITVTAGQSTDAGTITLEKGKKKAE